MGDGGCSWWWVREKLVMGEEEEKKKKKGEKKRNGEKRAIERGREMDGKRGFYGFFKWMVEIKYKNGESKWVLWKMIELPKMGLNKYIN